MTKRSWWLGFGGLLMLAGATGLFIAKSSRTGAPAKGHPFLAPEMAVPAPLNLASDHNLPPPEEYSHPNPLKEHMPEAEHQMELAVEVFLESEGKTPQDPAITTWESLVDQVSEQTNSPTAEQARRVKETFRELAPEDRPDGIQQAVNFLPDEQVPVLFEILYDKLEDPDVLDAIFSDVLNRPDEIKRPLLEALSQDRDHPMFFESARILDMIESTEDVP